MWYWLFRAQPVRVVDGDTIRVTVDLGFYLRNTVQVRLLGVDTPEPRGETRMAGLLAHEFVLAWMEEATASGLEWPLTIATAKSDSFDRWLARVNRAIDGRSLTNDLVDAGHAVIWRGRRA